MSTRVAALCCAGLLAAFAAIAWASVRTKGATFDEPVEAVAGWVQLHRGDARMNIEDPPLWKLWAALANGAEALRPDFGSSAWQQMPQTPALQWRFATATLWRTPGVDGSAVVSRGRAMMLVAGVLLGALIAFWAWRLGGPAAAVVSTVLFAFDPNFLAHAPLVKNDIAASLVMLAVACAVWHIGRRATAAGVIALLLLCGVALGIKFSCLLLGPLVVVLLGVRAGLSAEWPTSFGTLRGRAGRSALAAALIVGAALVAWAIVWTAYGWRFSATPDPAVQEGTPWVLGRLREAQAMTSGLALAAWQPDGPTRATLWALRHHLLPEAWLNGLLFTYATSVMRRGFLLGRLSSTGFWYYFPFAVLVKTPLAALVAFAIAAVAGIRRWAARGRSFEATWAVACVVLPPTAYFLFSLHTNMNIGIRHLLPAYAFAEVAAGVVLARLVSLPRWSVRAALGLALAAETLAAAPNFICFFNAAAGGPRGGLRLLGDSNLDWGQDLPLLAGWQRAHPAMRLYLSYFGMADPAFYGIRYQPLPGNYHFGPEPDGQPIEAPAVVVVSASHIQGINANTRRYAALAHWPPLAVLGGTLYLFDVPDAATASALTQLILRPG